MAVVSPPASLLRPWSDLLPELLGHIIAFLPFPGDRARLRAVCRGWCSAARRHVRQLPWLVLPDASFCTIAADGDDGCTSFFFRRGNIPGLPEDATIVGSTGAWLAVDRTDDPRRDVNHRHSYLLHNPFSSETVPLPELDDVISHVSDKFEVRKVLMRSPSSAPADDVIAVITNSCYCNVILCHPGKGVEILPYFGICDVAFLGDCLYGITADEDLLVFELDEDEDDGRSIVVNGKRVIKHPLADGEKDPWSWMDDDGDGDYDDNAGNDNDGDGVVNDDDKDIGPYTEVPYQGHAITTRKLVVSQGGELLMVRRIMQEPPFTRSFTREVKVFKADVGIGKWVPVDHDPLGQDGALFLSRAFSKCCQVFGDMKPGFMYFEDVDEVFDTRLWTAMPFTIPWQRKLFRLEWTTWVFPPEVVV
ncbi:hypothetical protein HU200_043941 [Digitaria exilis]|uniref:F-box domain-containing protein n=1 Tax=Digitaria exilis TaxID=1010633 RepID=A0A835B3N9_9POAL|nr:hypothetical protein HU200_043941 [Digitaria exilis]